MLPGSTLKVVMSVLSMMLVGLALAGCAVEEEEAQPVEIRVERQAASQSFRVSWQTSSPARALVFTRNTLPFRTKNWVIRDPRFKFETRNGMDVLISTAATTRFEISIPESFTEIRGDYPLMTSFSDGGVVLYTGYLNAFPIRCFQVCTDADFNFEKGARKQVAARITLAPSFGQRVVASTKDSLESISFDEPDEGFFAYFGQQMVFKGRGFAAILDPQLPAWLRPELERYLPQILDLNSRRLGKKLPSTPTVFVPLYGSSRRYAFTHSGAVAGNQILLALFGDAWERRTDEAREDFLKLVAHETFHLWNASLFHSVDRPGGRWLHEGSADAFAYLGLLELGVINRARYSELQTEALNRCLVGLSGTDLPSSNGPLTSRNHYDCGSVLQSLVHLSLKKNRSDLWSLWSDLFDRAATHNGFYTHDEFISAISNMGLNWQVPDTVVQLTSGAVKGLDTANGASLEPFFINAFRSAGVQLSAVDRKWPSWYHRLVAEKALSAAIESDCKGDGYFVTNAKSARLVGGPWCRNLKEDYEVTKVSGFNLWSEGVQVYDSIRRTCAMQSYVNVDADRANAEINRMNLSCPALPKRPAFLIYPAQTLSE